MGILGIFDVEDYGQAVYSQVIRSELARRLPAGHIRLFSPLGADRPTRSDRGEPAETLGPWSPFRVRQLADQLDLAVVGGGWLLAPDEARAAAYGLEVADAAVRSPRRFFVEGFTAEAEPGPGPPVRWHVTEPEEAEALRRAGVTGPIDVTPHPAVLLPRMVPASVLTKRLQYLRVMGWYPREGGALLIAGGPEPASSAGALLPALCQVFDDHPGLVPVVVELDRNEGDATFADALAHALRGRGGAVHRLPSTVSQEDVVAAVAGSDGFIGRSAAGCSTALAYGRPWTMLATHRQREAVTPALAPEFRDRLVREPEALVAAFACAVKSDAGHDVLGRLRAEVDGYLDLVATSAVEATRSRHPHGLPDPTRPALDAELRALRRAYRARVERSNGERALMADHVARAEAELSSVRREVDELRRRVDREAADRARFEAECAALRSTRTFRWTAPARSLFRRLGGGGR